MEIINEMTTASCILPKYKSTSLIEIFDLFSFIIISLKKYLLDQISIY